MDFFSAFSFLLLAAIDFDLDGRPLLLGAATFSAATFFGIFSFLALLDRAMRASFLSVVLAGVCLRADFGVAGFTALLATEAFEAVALEGDLETEALATDFLAVGALATEALAADFFATESLTAEALATEALAADFLATEALATEALATEALAADFLAAAVLAVDALAAEGFLAEGLEAFSTTSSLRKDDWRLYLPLKKSY